MVTTFGDEDKVHTMTTHGSVVSAFDPSKDGWTSYEERLRYYFIANDVAEGAKKHSILLTTCGMPTYKLICSLVQAENLDSTPYKDLVKIVKQHYDPKPSVTIQRYSHEGRRRVHLNFRRRIESARPIL